MNFILSTYFIKILLLLGIYDIFFVIIKGFLNIRMGKKKRCVSYYI